MFGLQGCTFPTSLNQNSSTRNLPVNYYQVFYYEPPIGSTANTEPYLVYNSGTNSGTSNTGNKSFIIDHPYDKDKYLVHVCLEGPEAGVYYRGKNKITNNKNTIIELPYYVDRLAYDFTISVTPIYNDDFSDSEEKEKEQISLGCSCVKNNKFKVYGKNCDFYWIVYGKRDNVNVEPLKALTNVKGDGPYKYL
jgi:hypothetical protein